MSQLSRKSRIVSLRLSPQEYEALKAHFRLHGARSISDFARLAMQRVMAASPDTPVALETKVHELDGRVSVLDIEIARLRALIEAE